MEQSSTPCVDGLVIEIYSEQDFTDLSMVQIVLFCKIVYNINCPILNKHIKFETAENCVKF
jgi:hypothetical protein